MTQAPGDMYQGEERRKKPRCPMCGSSLYEEYKEAYSGSNKERINGDCMACKFHTIKKEE